jgi:6,7-dimethyl-8-ribityllumazine synthase
MPSDAVEVIEGGLIVPQGARFALVASRFNAFIVESLLAGAVDALTRHGAAASQLDVVRVPGSWAVVALGAVIRGATAHFEHVANAVSSGVAQAAARSGVPITFGVLTTDTVEQATERAGTKAGNKGFDAALAAIEMVCLDRALKAKGL